MKRSENNNAEAVLVQGFELGVWASCVNVLNGSQM